MQSILSFFQYELNKFNDTVGGILNSCIYHVVKIDFYHVFESDNIMILPYIHNIIIGIISRCYQNLYISGPGSLVQWVASLTADSGVARLIPARSHTFVEIDHEIISMVILLLPLILEGLLSVTGESMCTKYWLTTQSSLHRKKVWVGELSVLT